MKVRLKGQEWKGRRRGRKDGKGSERWERGGRERKGKRGEGKGAT